MAVNIWEILESLDSEFSETLKAIALTKCDNVCAMMLTYSGEVYAVGKSSKGCLGLGETKSAQQPVKLEELSGVAGVSVCSGYGDALAYTNDGRVFVWGTNARSPPCLKPVLLPDLYDIVEARCRRGHYLALGRSGKVYQWTGVISDMSDTLNITPSVVPINESIVNIACGPNFSLALTNNGDVYIWGQKYNGSFAFVYQPLSKIALPGETVTKVACGDCHSLVLTQSGKVFTWGYNDYGLGDARSSIESDTPVQVGEAIGRFVDITVNGMQTNAAATESGVIYMWGRGENKKKVFTPKITDCKELHQVFARCCSSTLSWTCKTSDAASPPRCVTIVNESSASILEKIKDSFNDKESSDLTLVINNKPIYVHKYVLSLRSNFFRTMLQDHWTDKTEREVILKSYDFEVYKSYLWFLYSGEVTSTTEHLLDLWNLANAYSEDTLKLGCEKLMYKKNLTLETMALLYSEAMTKKFIESTQVQDVDSLQQKLEKLEVDVQTIQKKRERLEEDHTKIQQELQKLEKEQRKHKEEKQKTDEALLERLRALLVQTEAYKRSYEDPLSDIQENRTTLEEDSAKLKEDKRQIEKDYEKLKEDKTKIEKEYAQFKQDHSEMEKPEKLKEDNTREKDYEKLKEDYIKLKEEYAKQQEKLANTRAALQQFLQ